MYYFSVHSSFTHQIIFFYCYIPQDINPFLGNDPGCLRVASLHIGHCQQGPALRDSRAYSTSVQFTQFMTSYF